MKDQFKSILSNIFPGFVVSLVALPLCLGLALASGVPAFAGLVSAVVGALIVSLLGGSNLTITGPGNGLVVVSLAAVTTLGATPHEGYLQLIAAVSISGVLVFMFGLLKMGALSDFFPSAAVQGMLAAIGVIILSKQFHLMLGEMNPEGDSSLSLLASIPESLRSSIASEDSRMVLWIGLGSLAFLFLYGLIKNPLFHLVPAPMWVVLIAIALSYMGQNGILGIHPIDSKFLLELPSPILVQLVFPDFSLIWNSDFWSIVFALTFIASIESLLSIKAIDKLDPQQRRSNANKDLKALGLASVISGLLGGLPVVGVIARSSVNVTNGATNRSANLFHGLFIGIFVLAFTQYLQLIPISALAAILVFTGFRLAAPSVFKAMAKVGWAQFAIFIISLFATLLFGLINGIAIGIIATLIFQIGIIGKVELLIRNIFRPNTLMFEEEDGKMHISVRAFSNFLNFIGLKRKLDSLSRDSFVIVDFSLADFVDYSVMEQVNAYHLYFEKGGGNLEVIGLDDLSSDSMHPLASRRLRAKKNKSSSLTKRQLLIEEFSAKSNWVFEPKDYQYSDEFVKHQFFASKSIDRVRNQIIGNIDSHSFILADVDFHQGEYESKESFHQTFLSIDLGREWPEFSLTPSSFLDLIANLVGVPHIILSSHENFFKRYKLNADDEDSVKSVFNDDFIEYLDSQPDMHIRCSGKELLIFQKDRLSTISEIKLLFSFARSLFQLVDK